MSLVRKPYAPQIKKVSSVAGNYPPSNVFQIELDPYYDSETLYTLVDGKKFYDLGFGSTKEDAITDVDQSDNISTPCNLAQHLFSNVSYLNYNRVVNSKQANFFGKSMWLAMRRRVNYTETSNTVSAYTTSSFYMPHFDEPYTQVGALSPIGAFTANIWTSSLSVNSGEANAIGDSADAGDFYIKFNGDGTYHDVCVVISTYDHASGTDTPILNTIPLYFTNETHHNWMYSNNKAEAIDMTSSSEEEYVDRWRGVPYSFEDGVGYPAVIGNLAIKDNFDCIRLRLKDAPQDWRMYVHIMIDGEYMSADKVYIGRGENSEVPSNYPTFNTYTIGDTVKQLSSMNSVITHCAVKITGSKNSDPILWTVAPASRYVNGCPGVTGCNG